MLVISFYLTFILLDSRLSLQRFFLGKNGQLTFNTILKMTDLSTFDPNSVGNPSNNIFGLPFEEDDAQLIILPIPWEVTVSYNAGTARAPEHIFTASLQVDLFDPDVKDG